MKNFALSALLLAGFGLSAQETTTTTTTTTTTPDNSVTISAFGSFPEMPQAGISIEFLGKTESKTMKDKTLTWFSSKVAQLSFVQMEYELPGNLEVDGSGFAIDLGTRTYFSGKNQGLYTANYLSYGNITFDENIGSFDFDGTYSYFSFLSPEVGYKFNFGGFVVDPFAGVMWKLEVKGKGDIDNKNVDEWTPRIGIKIGYQF